MIFVPEFNSNLQTFGFYKAINENISTEDAKNCVLLCAAASIERFMIKKIQSFFPITQNIFYIFRSIYRNFFFIMKPKKRTMSFSSHCKVKISNYQFS